MTENKEYPDSLEAIHVKRVKDEVDVVLLPHKDGSGYSFVNLTKGHICPCVFPSVEAGLHDLEQKEDVLGWKRKDVHMSCWISADERLPEDSYESVIAIVSGNPSKSITLIGAYQFASYDEEGWYIDEFPEWDTPKVRYWMDLPDSPEEDLN
ncbi:DUF551 domain-containing protein [Intestinibacillus massiliensis]|nr:DUF551 domain-containing protein [Intestinibacillus massiliensis]